MTYRVLLSTEIFADFAGELAVIFNQENMHVPIR